MAFAALTVIGSPSVSATTAQQVPGRSAAVSGGAVGPLGPLADLAARRVLLGDKVAAAKFGTSQPIDDPVREQQLLDTVAAESTRLGLPVSTSVRIFRAQIEANKTVQRGLFQRWTEHPSERPSERPDLAKEVRPQLDQITGQILQQLLSTRGIRAEGRVCTVWLKVAEVSADVVNRLDRLHRTAMAIALNPVCEP